MKVSEFLIGIEHWLNSHEKVDGHEFNNSTEEFKFINEFESNNIDGSKINMIGNNTSNFYIRNTITSIISDELKVTIITKFNKDGEMIKIISWTDLKNLYNGFIGGINRRLVNKFGDKAIKRPYYTGNGKSEVKSTEIKQNSVEETKDTESDDKLKSIREFINKSGSIRLINALSNYDNNTIDEDKLIKLVNKYKSKKSS